MKIVTWRYEALLLSIAGMEACWVVAWSRVLLRRSDSSVKGLTWWSVWALFIIALTIGRTLGRLELRRGSWYVGAMALFSSLMLLWVNSGELPVIFRRPSDPSAAVEVLTLLLGFLVWFRGLRILGEAGDMRAMVRSFQIGLFILAIAMLITLQFPSRMNDLVVAYFGFGLLAIALTRVDEVAQVELGGAAPMNLKWVVTLTGTLLVGGAITLLVSQVITVDVVRWALRPFVSLLQTIVFISVVLATELALLILPLLQKLIGDLSAEQLQDTVQNMRRLTAPIPEEEAVEPARLSPQFVEAAQIAVIVLLVLLALWVIVRSFRRWQMDRYTTPGGVREEVASDASLAEDLTGYLRDQWRRLREVDLRHLFRRAGTGSIRAIYANMLALMAALDHPRDPGQTPYEYEPLATGVLPNRRAEIADITENYVRARYGEEEISAVELAHLQQAWTRVRAEGEELLKSSPTGIAKGL